MINLDNWLSVEIVLFDFVVEVWIDEIIVKMIIEQKVGQVIQVDSGLVILEDVKKY